MQLLQNDLFKYRSTQNEDPEVQNYLKTRKSLCIVETLLHQKVQLKNHLIEVNQFVLPAPYQKHMVLACHDEMGHLGMDSTLLLLQDRVYWPGMSKDVSIGGKKDPQKDINVLVVTDHFTRYAQAYVTTSQTAVTVARVLFTHFSHNMVGQQS